MYHLTNALYDAAVWRTEKREELSPTEVAQRARARLCFQERLSPAESKICPT